MDEPNPCQTGGFACEILQPLWSDSEILPASIINLPLSHLLLTAKLHTASGTIFLGIPVLYVSFHDPKSKALRKAMVKLIHCMFNVQLCTANIRQAKLRFCFVQTFGCSVSKRTEGSEGVNRFLVRHNLALREPSSWVWHQDVV